KNLNHTLVNSKLVECKSSSLVTTQNIHPSHLFNCCHSLCDSSLLGETVRANGHGHRQNSWHCNRDSSDEKHKKVVDTVSIRTVLDRIHDNDLNDHTNGDGADAEVANSSQHFLEMAFLVCVVYKMSCFAEESV